MRIGTPDIAIDVGTCNTRIYVRGKGIVINEPSVLLARKRTRNGVEYIGEDAVQYIGRSTRDLQLIQPIQESNIKDFESAQILVHHFLGKALGRVHLNPRVVYTISSAATSVDRQTMKNMLDRIGLRRNTDVQQCFAAALGAGMQVYEPRGNLVVDIGGGTTEVALISLGGIVLSHTVKTAGLSMDAAIISFLKEHYAIEITQRAAEQVKFDLVDVRPKEEIDHAITIRGRDVATAMPVTVDVRTPEICEAIQAPLRTILEAIRYVLGRVPPEMCQDVLQNGIALTGGSSALPNLDLLIADTFGVPAYQARDASECCILGVGYLADHFDEIVDQKRKDEI